MLRLGPLVGAPDAPGCTYVLPYDHHLEHLNRFLVKYLNVSLPFNTFRTNGVKCDLHALNLTAANHDLIKRVYARDAEMVLDAARNWSHLLQQ